MIFTKEEILGLLKMSYGAQIGTLIEWDIIDWEYYGRCIGNKRPLESRADLAYRLRDQIIDSQDVEKIYRFFQSMDEVAGEKRPLTPRRCLGKAPWTLRAYHSIWLLLKMQPIEMICAALLAEQSIKKGGEE